MRSNYEDLKTIKKLFDTQIRGEKLVNSCKAMGIRVVKYSMGGVIFKNLTVTKHAGNIKWTQKKVRIQLDTGIGTFNRSTCAELDVDGTVEMISHISFFNP